MNLYKFLNILKNYLLKEKIAFALYFYSNVFHEHDSLNHLKIKEGKADSPILSLTKYDGIEEKFCPAKVYSFNTDEKGKKTLQIDF